MKDSDMPVEFRIFVEGIIAGLISGIGFKTGISPDEGSILISIMKEFWVVSLLNVVRYIVV